VERNAEGETGAPLRLNGDGIAVAGLEVDGKALNDWRMDGDDLVIDLPGDKHRVVIETVINPTANTQLSGLYASGGMLCTQCEAEGFRRITFFPDRPDVLSRYRVRMIADKRIPGAALQRQSGRVGRRAQEHPLGRMARSLAQAFVSLRAGRGRSGRDARHVHHPVGPQGRSGHLGPPR
jgi:aminopeptidase N